MACNPREKDYMYETVSTSGMVYLTLDNQLVFWNRFEQQIKVNILYDKGLPGLGDVHNPHAFHAEVVPADNSVFVGDDGFAGTQSQMKSDGSIIDAVFPLPLEKLPSSIEVPHGSSELLVPVCVEAPLEGGGPSQDINIASQTEQDTQPSGQALPSQMSPLATVVTEEQSQSDENIASDHEESVGPSTQDSDFKGKKRKRSSKRLAVKGKNSKTLTTSQKEKVDKKYMQVSKSTKTDLSVKITLCNKSKNSKVKSESQEQREGQAESSRPEAKNKDRKNKQSKAPKVRKLEQEKDVYCEYCQTSFKSQQEYFDHRKGDRTTFKCKYCHKTVPFKAHLLVHMRKHNSARTEDILAPGEVVREESQESDSKGDSGKGSIRCDICGLTVSNIPILKTHTMIHTEEFAYKCCVCGEKTHSIAKHNNHMATHLKSGKVQCKICNISFPTRSDLSKHQLTHEFKCNICDKVFLNKTSRVFHYKMAHKEDIMKCHICGKLFSSEEELRPHLKYHRNRAKTQCTICGLFVTRLDNHILSHNQRPEDSKMYVCDQCPKQFKQKLSFQRHLRTHSEEKPYACMECPKKFARSGGLRRHMITHTQEKPFVCDVCGKACSQMGNLRIHMQIHKDTTPVHCHVCGETFTYKNSLQEHMRTMHYMDMNAVNVADPSRYLSAVPPVYYVQ